MSVKGLSSDPPTFRKRKAWAITINPGCGITEKHIEDFPKLLENWMVPNRLYAVVEKKDTIKSHIHGLFLTEKETNLRQDNFRTSINGVLKEYFGESFNKYVTMKLKYVYNHDWEKKYTTKEMRDNCIYDTIGDYTDFLPSPAEQLEAIKKAHSKTADTYFDNLEKLWNEYHYEWEEDKTWIHLKIRALKFLTDMMYVHRRISVIRDRKCIIAVAEGFRNYQRKKCDYMDFLTKEEKELLSQWTSNDMSV